MTDFQFNMRRFSEIKESIGAQTNPFVVLDFVWAEINALGGAFPDCADQYDRAKDEGFSEAIDAALAVIEQLGGQDPLTRRPAFPLSSGHFHPGDDA